MKIVYPIVEYAKKIGKNTAQFTVSDMQQFMKWWMSQPQRVDLIERVLRRIDNQQQTSVHNNKTSTNIDRDKDKNKDKNIDRDGNKNRGIEIQLTYQELVVLRRSIAIVLKKRQIPHQNRNILQRIQQSLKLK